LSIDILTCLYGYMDTKTDKQKTGGQAGTDTKRQAGRQADKQTDK
jgi:hypothetical protein